MNKTIMLISYFSIVMLNCYGQDNFKVFIPQNDRSECYKYLEQFCDENSFIVIENNEDGLRSIIHLLRTVDYFINVSEENLTYVNTIGEGGIEDLYKTKRIYLDDNGELQLEEYDDYGYVLSPNSRFAIEGGLWDGFIPITSVSEQYETQMLKYYRQIANLFATVLNCLDSSYIVPIY